MALLLVITAITTSAATPFRLTVLYPEVKGDYQKVYQNIIEGIQTHPAAVVNALPVARDTPVESIQNWLGSHQSQAVLALGLSSYQATQKLHTPLPVVVGALVFSPNGISGVSMAGAPAEFIQRLRELSPETRRIFVVYSQVNSGWLVEMAREEAAKVGITIVAHQAKDPREATHHFQRLLQEVRGREDAVWLPLDSVIPHRAILPTLLEEAWKRRFVVFSNNPSHTEKGALFSLFPDNQAMGQTLADLAVRKLVTHAGPTVIPTTRMKLAVNKRTASHLGLRFPHDLETRFDLVYPAER